MAKKVETDEERLRRLLLIRDYALLKIANNETFSTRSIANYFNEHAGEHDYFKVSNNTVSDYIERLKKIDHKSYIKIREILDENKPKTINDEEVITRIEKVIKLILEDYTIEEIATILEESPNTINKDINTRLIRMDIDKETLKKVKEKLIEHSKNNSPFLKKH